MSAAVLLTYRHLRYHRGRTLLLVVCIALILFLPAALVVLGRQAERQLLARSASTPLVIGAKGSLLDLTLNSLYFQGKQPEAIRFDETAAIAASGLANPIPLHVRFRSERTTIVGTSLDYFPYRGLKIAQGRMFSRWGECVIGVATAKKRKLQPGDTVLSNAEQAFDLAGVRPLKLQITGILAEAGTPDDDAIFTDVKTCWIIEGLGHGHDDLAPNAAGKPVEFREITDANLRSFHFHGDQSGFPLTAILPVCPDEKSTTRLIGRYQSNEAKYQLVEPPQVLGELLGTFAEVKRSALIALGLVAGVMFVLVGLVQSLAWKMRKQELRTLRDFGATRGQIARLLVFESGVIVCVGAILAAGFTALVSQLGLSWLRPWLI